MIVPEDEQREKYTKAMLLGMKYDDKCDAYYEIDMGLRLERVWLDANTLEPLMDRGERIIRRSHNGDKRSYHEK